jgi:hypothetical protein
VSRARRLGLGVEAAGDRGGAGAARDGGQEDGDDDDPGGDQQAGLEALVQRGGRPDVAGHAAGASGRDGRQRGEAERAAEENAGASAAERLGAIGLAYRAWGTARPHRYRLAIQTRLGSGELVPERVIPAAQRAMEVILDAIEGLPAARRTKQEPPADLRSELDAWTRRVGGQQRPPAILLRGVTFWSRLHGLVSLELDRHLASMQLDPELLYRTELAELGAKT